MFIVTDNFYKIQFLKHFITKIMPIFCQLNLEFGKRHQNDLTVLRVIFDQWQKLNLGFDVKPEIRILKIIYLARLCKKK